MSESSATTKRPSSWKDWLWTGIRIAVAVGLCIFLAVQLDWSEIGKTLAQMDPLWAVVGIVVLFSGLGIAVVRWARILRALGSPLDIGSTVRVFGAGLFLNLFLPTSVGGDVYRLARASADGFGARRATLSLAIERGIGLLALMMIVAPAIMLHPRTRDFQMVGVIDYGLLGALMGAGCIVLLVAARFWGAPIADALSGRFPALEPVVGREARSAIRGQVMVTFGLSFLIHIATIASNYFFAKALHVPLTFVDALALVPLIVLAGQIPISPGGLGVRESAFVLFLGRVGIAPEPAFAVGLLWLVALYLTGAIGGLLFLADRRRPQARPEQATRPAPTGPSGVDSAPAEP